MPTPADPGIVILDGQPYVINKRPPLNFPDDWKLYKFELNQAGWDPANQEDQRT